MEMLRKVHFSSFSREKFMGKWFHQVCIDLYISKGFKIQGMFWIYNILFSFYLHFYLKHKRWFIFYKLAHNFQSIQLNQEYYNRYFSNIWGHQYFKLNLSVKVRKNSCIHMTNVHWALLCFNYYWKYRDKWIWFLFTGAYRPADREIWEKNIL